MKNHKDVLADGSDYQISLAKVLGKKVKDVHGYISMEFDEPVFKLTDIIMEDGTDIGCEGEHDFPYLAYGEKAGLTEEVMDAIFKSDPENAEEA